MKVLEIEPGEPHATEALQILDAALAEAKAKGSDGKAETKAAAKKISDISAATAPPPVAAAAAQAHPPTSGAPRHMIMGQDGRATGLSIDEYDNLLTNLDRIDAALTGGEDKAAAGAPPPMRNRTGSVLDKKAANPTAGQDQRSYVRDLAAPPQLRKAAPRDNFGGLEAKLTSALSKLDTSDEVGDRKKYSLGPRIPGTVIPEAVKIVYANPGETKYPYADLKSKRIEGVDPSRKEEYLTADEFKKVFSKTLEEFQAFPAWKKVREKKRVNLF